MGVQRVQLTEGMIDQTYGVDLELRARGDRKRVPLIVTGILQYLDNRKFINFAI